ncbi:MAG: 1-(5-phosphoribosyl)-5-[(5-phosphoribosylamino)methylideneamino]imidazole-4-carboxamide isomerase, partial [Euryarchaeota archaeon]|nr:1-(5-phosphoribosyl)-5-[(5-phosphoribosylamino)methylideneamino]imidazole-4-carboxamide isomerase [Euryarchaeota archaeon]
MFLVIPALDLKDGKCVRLRQGDPRKKTIELENPLEIARNWEALGAPRLHLVDLDGAIGGERKNEQIVREIIQELAIPVQFGGGIRSIEDARLFLDLGAEKIIIGTIAIQEPKIIEKLAEKYGRERIIVALDSRNGKVVIKGWTEATDIKAAEIVGKFEKNASEILFTNVDVEGMMKGIDEKAVKEMVDSTSLGVLISGGISSLDDIKKIKKLGAKGAVIGSALYKGK